MANDVEKFKRAEWTEYVDELAGKIADEKLKQNKRYLKQEPTEEARDKYATEYSRRILKRYPFDGEKPVEDVFTAMESTGNESLLRWLDGDQSFDPFKVQEKAKADKFLPILHGVAPEGADWYSMGSTPLMIKAAELGYDPSTKEGYSEFLKDVAKYQQQHDRGELVAEMRDDPRYLLGTLVAPTATKAIEDAVATGGDLSPLEAVALSGVDAVANAGMFAAPSINFLKANPILQGVINAGIQGAEEGARQGLGFALADTDVDVAAPFIAASLGATRPGMVGSVQSIATQFQRKNARDFARGIMKATRAGDPAVEERNSLQRAFEQFNKNLDVAPYSHGVAVAKYEPTTFSNFSKAAQANNARKYTEALDAIHGENARPGKIDVDAYLKLYDDIPRIGLQETREGKATLIDPVERFNQLTKEIESFRKLGSRKPGTPNVFDETAKGFESERDKTIGIKLSPDNVEIIKNTFPAKFAEVEGDNAWTRAGTVLGSLLADVGGRIEPIIRANPFAGTEALKPQDYKETSWYRKLDKGSKSILDAAIKARREELGGDNLE